MVGIPTHITLIHVIVCVFGNIILTKLFSYPPVGLLPSLSQQCPIMFIKHKIPSVRWYGFHMINVCYKAAKQGRDSQLQATHGDGRRQETAEARPSTGHLWLTYSHPSSWGRLKPDIFMFMKFTLMWNHAQCYKSVCNFDWTLIRTGQIVSTWGRG